MPNLFVLWKPLSGCRVLIGEDNPAQREYYRALLDRQGADAVPLEDGEAVIREFRNGEHTGVRPDAVLLDFLLTDMRGTEVAASLRASGFAGAIVGITAAASSEDVEYWLASGCDEVVNKRQDRREIVAAMVSACARRWVSLGRVDV